MKAAMSHEVWAWPEFKALATRLGIDLSRPATRIGIVLQFDSSGHPVRIDHQYIGENGPETEKA